MEHWNVVRGFRDALAQKKLKQTFPFAFTVDGVSRPMMITMLYSRRTKTTWVLAQTETREEIDEQTSSNLGAVPPEASAQLERLLKTLTEMVQRQREENPESRTAARHGL